MNSIWVINEDSAYYTWEVFGTSKDECEREFRKMWKQWCKATGADVNYWGKNCSDVGAREVKLGVGYMDKEQFRV